MPARRVYFRISLKQLNTSFGFHVMKIIKLLHQSSKALTCCTMQTRISSSVEKTDGASVPPENQTLLTLSVHDRSGMKKQALQNTANGAFFLFCARTRHLPKQAYDFHSCWDLTLRQLLEYMTRLHM